MKVELEQDVINKAIQDSATKAIADALKGFSVISAIADVVTEQVAHGAITEAIKNAVQNVDTDDLIKHLSKEMQAATTKAVVVLLQEGGAVNNL